MATQVHDQVAPQTEQPPTPPQPRRFPLPVLFAALVLLAGAGWGLQKYLYGRSHETSDNAQVDGHITPIAAKVTAFVQAVLVDDNQPVLAGDTLVLLDGREARAKLVQAEADLANARAMVGSTSRAGQAQAQLEASRATAEGLGSAVRSAEAGYRKAEADLSRYRQLAERQIISAQQLDAAQAAYDAARANLETTRRQAAAAGSQVAAAAAALQAADARLAAQQAAVDQARLQVSYSAVVAPSDGIVARRSVEPGELVQPGQLLLSVVPTKDIWVTANLKETQLGDVTPGDPVTFTVDAYPGRTFHGAVESLSPATGARFALLPPDNATGNFTKVVQRVPVRIAVEGPIDPTTPLRPGLSATVTITTR